MLSIRISALIGLFLFGYMGTGFSADEGSGTDREKPSEGKKEEGSGKKGGKRQGRSMEDKSPAIQQTAPDFTLKSIDGKTETTLSDSYKEKPVVLVFGSYTCPPFRRALPEMEALYKKYQEKMNFHFVYIREAHPTDGWKVGSNEKEKIQYKQPKTWEERAGIANDCRENVKVSIPTIIDSIDNKVDGSYSSWPNRVYIINKEGTIQFKGRKGPRGTVPDDVEKAIEAVLAGKTPEVGTNQAGFDRNRIREILMKKKKGEALSEEEKAELEMVKEMRRKRRDQARVKNKKEK